MSGSHPVFVGLRVARRPELVPDLRGHAQEITPQYTLELRICKTARVQLLAGLCHKLDQSLIRSVEQKNLGGNTDRLAPIQRSPIPEFSMLGSRDEMSASGKVVVNGGLD